MNLYQPKSLTEEQREIIEKMLVKCPYCGGRGIVENGMGRDYISAEHTPECRMEPSTYHIVRLPIEKQIEAWNQRENVIEEIEVVCPEEE